MCNDVLKPSFLCTSENSVLLTCVHNSTHSIPLCTQEFIMNYFVDTVAFLDAHKNVVLECCVHKTTRPILL